MSREKKIKITLTDGRVLDIGEIVDTMRQTTSEEMIPWTYGFVRIINRSYFVGINPIGEQGLESDDLEKISDAINIVGRDLGSPDLFVFDATMSLEDLSSVSRALVVGNLEALEKRGFVMDTGEVVLTLRESVAPILEIGSIIEEDTDLNNLLDSHVLFHTEVGLTKEPLSITLGHIRRVVRASRIFDAVIRRADGDQIDERDDDEDDDD